MTKYSKGTWKILTNDFGFPAKITSNDGHVCSFLGSVKSYCGHELITANATLISAAPDLLVALKFLTEATESLCSTVQKEGWEPNKANDAVKQAKRALQKATE